MENYSKELELLILKVKKGDKSSITKLIEVYIPFVKRIVRYYGMFVGRDEREDLFIEGLLSILRVVSIYDEKKGNFNDLAFVAVRNAIFDALERRKKAVSGNHVPAGETDIEDVMIIKEEIEDFAKLLTSFEREVFELYLQGYKIREISERLNKNYKSIDNAMQRIKKRAKIFV